MASFFVPGVSADAAEPRYRQLADDHCLHLAHPRRRIQSICWLADTEEWTAEVGKQLHGSGPATTRTRGHERAVTDPL